LGIIRNPIALGKRPLILHHWMIFTVHFVCGRFEVFFERFWQQEPAELGDGFEDQLAVMDLIELVHQAAKD